MAASDPVAQLGEALALVVRQTVHDAVIEALGGTGSAAADRVEMVAVSEAAHRLGLGTTTTKRLIASGRLRSVVVGRRRLVPVEAIANYAAGLPKVAS